MGEGRWCSYGASDEHQHARGLLAHTRRQFLHVRVFDGVFRLFPRWDLRWDPCGLPLIWAGSSTFPVAGIWIGANFGAGIRSHLPSGPPGALDGSAMSIKMAGDGPEKPPDVQLQRRIRTPDRGC